ncbi:hypothetical protein E1287_07370 [Actinomadura sp. KC06]|uniref:hypothetical protein n=1 Tax=Actinomadura sp. KC06 TaxID=2530369 RepID=UPI001048954B|nr:hypothetical protein [Actinomadura sp. KC06]TDD37867.1 hypothetical protein E1287_07370 [Actinomadura sp. KC06]
MTAHTPGRAIPARDEFRRDEHLVEILDDRPDSENRITFYAYWHDDKTPAEGGPPAGVRGQIYVADLDKFTAHAAKRGINVRRWP